MPVKENVAAICPDCGTQMETTTSGDLGCMVCLLRVGLDDADEPEEKDAGFAPLPDQFGPYTIARHQDGTPWELGRGAMGVTFRAIDTSLARPVALKIIQADLGGRGADARERFIREARSAAALRHPNIATVYHFGIREETGQCFYAMELVEGETLEMRVRRSGPLDVLASVDIALQVSRALAAAEKQGLVHRDLKPANLMLTAAPAANDSNPAKAEETETVVKVIDFGVAKVFSEKPEAKALTHGGFIGTPAFASPEQFTNAPVDVRSDIYSLGATLWYLLTGHMPFSGASLEQIRASQQSRALPIEQLRAARVPNRLMSLLVSMLALEPAARPGVQALASKLQECRAQILDRWKTARQFALIAGLIGTAAAAFVPSPRWHNRATSASAPEKSIAVLPFENRSEDKANTYFADGIQDEILTRLAKIGDLKVISRTSTEKYRGRPINLKTVAEELGVSAVLEGSVQKASGKVRVVVQLIEATSDHHLWAETYDRLLEDVFAVQSEIAGAVASALHATLTPEESVALQNVPTHNHKAYDLFLRAEYFFRIGQGNMRLAKMLEAIVFYRQAVAEDPRFALAYARLSHAESFVRFIGADPAGDPPDQAKIDAEKAAALQPDLVQAHLALAYYDYLGRLDYSGALRHLARAQALAPRSVEVLSSLAGVYRRQLRLNDAIAALERATHYDPGNSDLFADLASTYSWAKRFDKLQPALEHALALNPGDDGATLALAQFFIEQRGDVEDARKLLGGRGQFLQVVLADTYRLTREYDKALRLIEELPADSDAFASSEKSKNQLLGGYLHSAGQDQLARPLLERAREQRIALLADKTLSHRRVSFNSIRLAEVELALGNGQAAVQIAEHDAQSDWVTRDPTFLHWYRGFLAKIYAKVGRHDEAIALISEILKSEFHFTDITPITLRLDPDWDPLRAHPRFQALMKEYPIEGWTKKSSNERT